MSLGNVDYGEAWIPEGWHNENREFPLREFPGYQWYARMFEDPAFRARYSARWRALRQNELSDARLMADIDKAVATMGKAVDRNYDLWDWVLGEYLWPNPSGFEQRTTFESEIAFLKQWLNARMT